MVKIPKLTEDRQNWKIYHAKFLKVTATYDCLKVLAGRPYEGDNWDGCNALLCCTFMESIPPSIYFRCLCYTAHENFKYLAKHFCDNEPIPCTNELQCTGTATALETPVKTPMSADATTEQHVHAKLDTKDLSTATKDLERGMKSVNNGIVGCQDLRTSLEALAQGTSTNCTETTAVTLESAQHEMQNWLQNSLQMTPRLPIKDKPSKCMQEAAESVVTDGCTNGMAEMAKPTIADVNRTALLDGEPVEMACGVDEGNEMGHKDLQLPKAGLYCKERHQHNENVMDDIPSTHGLPLEGGVDSISKQ